MELALYDAFVYFRSMYKKLPSPPYYAVIFSSKRTVVNENYNSMAQHMEKLAAKHPGYLGIESYREADGTGCTISYWRSETDILRWKSHAEHLVAQELGKKKWYEHYTVRVAKVERQYQF